MRALRWLLVTVSDSSPESQANLRTLLASVEAQTHRADMVLVMRGGGAPPVSDCVDIHPVPSPHRIPLSRARNLGLARAAEHGLLEKADVVAFPDDDASYPDGLMDRVGRALSAGTAIAGGAYAPTLDQLDQSRFPSMSRPLTPGVVMRTSSSNNTFFRGEVVRAVGRFDERFGLGARYGAGEDSDYVLRALRRGYAGRYDPSIVVLHPYKVHRPMQYYPGNVAVLARHLRGGHTALLLARRLATGLVMTLRGRLPVSDYLALVLGAAGLALRGGPPELPLGRVV